MKLIRQKIFETNSSSTHSLTVVKNLGKNYAPYGNHLKIRWINTDDEYVLTTLKDKVSYLVSHIASWYKWDVENYEDLIDEIKNNWDFKRIENYVQEKYHKNIIFPEYDGCIEDIVEINHQLVSWYHNIDDVIEDMLSEERDLLDEVLQDGKCIEFGRD